MLLLEDAAGKKVACVGAILVVESSYVTVFFRR